MARFHGTAILVVLLVCTPACDGSSSSTSGGGAGGGAGGSASGGAPGAGGAGGDTSTAGGGDSMTGTGTAATTGTGGSSGSGGGSSGTELIHADFEATAPGTYTEDMVSSDFGGAPPWNNGLDEGRAVIVEEGGGRFLRVTYPAGEYGPGDGGVQFKVPLGGTHEELYLSYRVRFAAGFSFVKGGKLPGLVGGSAPTGCVDDTTGFSARMMWRTGGAAVQYMYFPEKVNPCGDDHDYAGAGGAVHFEPGTWHTVEHRLLMNTPGVHDGALQAWFDGAPALDEQGFLFRLEGASFGIDALYFSTFFGGGDASWAPDEPQVVDFDDFIVSTGPISH